MNDEGCQERNSLQENKDCDLDRYTSILVECRNPSAVESESIKSFFQKCETDYSGDVAGVIYPFRGNRSHAAVIFDSPDSARFMCSKSYTEYATVKPLRTLFSKVCATIDNQQWALIESASGKIEYYVQDVVGALMNTEGPEPVRTIVGTRLQIEEVDRYLGSLIENHCTVRQHDAAEVSNVPSVNAQDLTSQLSSSNGAPSPERIAKGGGELETSATILTGSTYRGLRSDMSTLPQRFQMPHATVPSGIPEASFMMFGTTVRVYKGDLTEIRVDAIVNPANKQLSNGAGAALAIANAAGKEFDERCRSYILNYGELSTGKAVGFRASGRLLQHGVEHVINCVGPVYCERSDDDECHEMLATTVLNCLIQAESLKCASVAMPAISSGIYGVPLPICTAAYVNGVCRFFSGKLPQYVRDIHFVDLDESMCYSIREEFSRCLQNFVQMIVSRTSETRSVTSSTPSRDDNDDRWWWNSVATNTTSVSHPRTTNTPFTSSTMFSWQRPGLPTPLAASSERDAPVTSSSSMAAGLTKATQSHAPSFAAGAVESDRSTSSMPAFRAAAAAAAVQSNYVVKGRPALHADTSESLPRSDESKCPICLDTVIDAKTLPCSHTFCRACVNNPHVTSSALCPTCRVPFGISRGNQPQGGSMTTKTLPRSLPGYHGVGTIEIHYSIPSGIQSASHPNPGRPYSGTKRTAYLPGNAEGQDVLRLLAAAFDRGLTFTIGTSHTTGQRDCVVWNDIHHKTAIDGGPTSFGYPDPHYLTRVKEELAAKGVR